MTQALAGKVYVVTGGSKGFGLAIAKALAAADARVGLLSRSQESLDQAVAEIGSDHALGVTMDVGSREDISRAFGQVKTHFGRLDGLVNNAGLAYPASVENLLEDEVIMQVNTNFLGTVFCCQAAIPLLRGGENPRIINISSASAWHYDEMHHLSIYAATKAAVERFSRDLRMELVADEIGVTCIRPGGATTTFAEGWNQERTMKAFSSWQASGGMPYSGMTAEHLADAVVQCLSYPSGVAVDLMEIRPNRPTQ